MILFLAGTSDARALAIHLQSLGYSLIATVVTESAAESLQANDIPYQVGRLTVDDMAALIRKNEMTCVVDASHPYAEEASKTAMEAAKLCGIPYVRYERPKENFVSSLITEVESYEDAARLAQTHKGTIMLTTGSKTLEVFADYLLRDGIRLICRMLPNAGNMEKCDKLGIKQKDIIAIQGPFSESLNKSLCEQYDVTLMITKESGKVGSVDEKITAALELDIPVILIKRPKVQYENFCTSFEKVTQLLGGFTLEKSKHEL
ncbi:precorrin-6x reductase [Sporosarcina sp. P37]|uniref:precorrin-6A reductase n=1 Tax=unclassified Sporosarcina TaxID=2647733 RepID=UPI0009C0743C|nr:MULTISPECIES: precorrin-6A reductase [unclassified Sporosarcina]ARD48120.1 precorrin-6x reductase [Sporosarcina sp. P33]ARK24633.1 precorrin-6x reductase [Sporosarcina sp. P37]PID19790.1 precorrin-6A reductase [Sporosarcina sp. P35]